MIDFFFLLPSKGKFLNGFNEQLRQQADSVWRQIDGLSPFLLILGLFLGVGLAVFYYRGFNERPGRHYKMKYWAIWALLSVIITMVATIAIEYVGVKTNLKSGYAELYWLCAINNALYAFGFYLFTSVVWCNAFPTNAYKFFKFKL